MKLLITGGTGQLGRAIQRLASDQHDIIAPGSASLDASCFEQVRDSIDACSPDLVIHAGALTNVDNCEHDIARAFRVNALGSQNVAAVTAQADIPVVYLSTNFVFDGELDRPYTEFHEPRPISTYGLSKLAGERAVTALNPRHYVVRTAMVYDETGRNFVQTMLRLASGHSKLRVVADQFGNPTYATDLGAGILKLIEQSAYGIYHLTNRGSTSWHGWAVKIFELAGIDVEVEAIPANAYPRAATPPANGVLDNLAAAGLGIELPDWDDALARCLRRRSEITG